MIDNLQLILDNTIIFYSTGIHSMHGASDVNESNTFNLDIKCT